MKSLTKKKVQKCEEHGTKETTEKDICMWQETERRKPSVALFDPSWECVYWETQMFLCLSSNDCKNAEGIGLSRGFYKFGICGY